MNEPESPGYMTLVVDGPDRLSNRDWLTASQDLGYVSGLDRIKLVLARLNHPERGLSSIHVAGTNGKGTTCAHLANMLWMEGSRVGLFTTPHLCKVEERVRVDGDLITAERFDAALETVRSAASFPEPIILSFYEITFLVALVTFRQMGVEWAVFETGLGGRLDPTTLVEAELCIITSIGLDHKEMLGPTLSHIALEKASIYRPGIPFIATLPDDDDVRQVIESVVDADHGYWVHPAWPEAVSFHDLSDHLSLVESMMDLPPVIHYSIEAHRLAAHALAVLDPELLTFESINASLLQTHWPGRTPLSEPVLLAHAPGVVMFEAAHNIDGMLRACRDLLGHFVVDGSIEEIFFPDVILFGATQKDDLEGFVEPFLQLLEFLDEPLVILTEPVSGRYPPVPAHHLQRIFESQSARCETAIESDPKAAFEKAMSVMTPIVAEARTVTGEDDVHALMLIIGSLYLIGDLLPHICESSDLELDDQLSILQLRPPNLGMLGE